MLLRQKHQEDNSNYIDIDNSQHRVDISDTSYHSESVYLHFHKLFKLQKEQRTQIITDREESSP